MSTHSLFAGRVAVLASMHKKERAIAPILEQELGGKVIVLPNFNTDIFGTFTKEINRTVNQIKAAKLKAEKALTLTGETLAIASEGTFISDSDIPYIFCDRGLEKTSLLKLTLIIS